MLVIFADYQYLYELQIVVSLCRVKKNQINKYIKIKKKNKNNNNNNLLFGTIGHSSFNNSMSMCHYDIIP